MNNISDLLALLRGKRTYLVAALSAGYLILCQFTKQPPSETVMGIFGALGLAALRAGIPSPPSQPAASSSAIDIIRSTVPIWTLCLLGSAVMFTGCISGRQKDVVTKEVVFRYGTNEVRIRNPQDTSFKDLMISPDGVVRIKDYRSAANEAAIVATEKQAEFQNKLTEALFQRMDQRIDQVGVPLARTYGIPVQPLEPMTPSSNAQPIQPLIPRSVALPATNAPTAK